MRPATTDRFTLAEGPVWDGERNRLLWVDIVAGDVFEGTLSSSGTITTTRRHHFTCQVGAVAFADDGSLVVAAHDRIVAIGTDGGRVEVVRLLHDSVRRRLNDAAVDPTGRFVVGTLDLDKRGGRSEQLLRLEPAGGVTVLDDDLSLSNGIAWSTDSSRMYSVDTLRRTVHVRDHDGERRAHLVLDDGYPDGIAMDAENHLWIAVWGLGEVRRYSPTGEMVDRLVLPAPHTSSVTFAGDDLRTLVVTTAIDELTPEQLLAHPESGRLFTRRTDVAGIPATPWRKVAPCD